MDTPRGGANDPTMPIDSATGMSTPSGGMTTPPRREFQEYEVLDEIAQGGMGVVYRARQRKLGRVVALKTLRAGVRATSEDLARFTREAQTAARLVHPGIIPIHDFGVVDGVPFFSMDFIEGRTMAALLEAGSLGLRPAVGILEKVCRAMHYAHQQGVIHRDLKPGNILVDASGEPRLADFGVAKSLFGEATLTREGAIMGTPAYLAPEQVGGDKDELGPWTDVYALGVTLYHVLTGRVPFQGTTELELLYKITLEEPPPPRAVRPDAPPELEVICLKAMQKDRVNRYRSAMEMAEELSRWLANQPILTRPESVTQRTFKLVRRKRASIGLVLAGIALGAVAVGIALWPRKEAPGPPPSPTPVPVVERAEPRPYEVDVHTVALWHFDDGVGNQARDAGTGGHHVFLKNGVEWGEGRFGKAIHTGFVGGRKLGETAYAFASHDVRLDLAKQFTVECWVKPLTLQTQESFVWSKYVYKDGLGSALAIMGIGDPSYASPVFKVGTSTNGYLSVRGPANAFALGEWHHVATTYEGEAFRIWVDGRVVGEQRAKDATPNAATIELTIGTSSDLPGWNPLDGWIDEFRISNVARTPGK